jgi:hypothetical protein
LPEDNLTRLECGEKIVRIHKPFSIGGRILAGIYTENGFTPAKLRDLHFDVLIALTTRSHGCD